MVQAALTVLLMLFSAMVRADAGLTYDTFACNSWPCPNSGPVVSSGVTPNINYNWGNGQVLNSKRRDNVSVIFRGKIIWPGETGQQRTVTFYTSNDDGLLLKINDQTVINDWSGLHGPSLYNASGSITLTAGKIYNFELWYSEWTGGAVVQLFWNIGAGIVIVPGSAFFYNVPLAGGGTSSEITDAQIVTYNNSIGNYGQIPSGNRIYIDQSGTANNIRIEQHSRTNSVQGLNGNLWAGVSGSYNDITIRQGNPSTITGKNLVELNLSGNSNIVEINQSRSLGSGLAVATDSNGHITRLNILGSNNILQTQQSNNLLGQHYMNVEITGNGNGLILQQVGDNSKKIFATVQGNNNSINAQQTDAGGHYLDISLYGPGNSATITQRNSGTHRATISLTNSGGANNINLVQQGTINQIYNLIQSCVTPSGCSIAVTQGP